MADTRWDLLASVTTFAWAESTTTSTPATSREKDKRGLSAVLGAVGDRGAVRRATGTQPLASEALARVSDELHAALGNLELVLDLGKGARPPERGRAATPASRHPGVTNRSASARAGMNLGPHHAIDQSYGKRFVSRSCLQNWVAQAAAEEKAAGEAARPASAERKELAELRRRNKQLEAENQILKRAAAYFASETKSRVPSSWTGCAAGVCWTSH